MSYTNEIWTLQTPDEIQEFYTMIDSFQDKAIGWAIKQIDFREVDAKSGDEIFSEARKNLASDIISGKAKIFKNYAYTKNTLFNYMKRIIARCWANEARITHQNGFSGQENFEASLNKCRFKDEWIPAFIDEEFESYIKKLLRAFATSLSGLEKEIVDTVLSDNNDLSRMLVPVTKELTPKLIAELKEKGYINEQGDTLEKFKKIKCSTKMNLSKEFNGYRRMIYKIVSLNRVIVCPQMLALYLHTSTYRILKSCKNLRKYFKKFNDNFDNDLIDNSD